MVLSAQGFHRSTWSLFYTHVLGRERARTWKDAEKGTGLFWAPAWRQRRATTSHFRCPMIPGAWRSAWAQAGCAFEQAGDTGQFLQNPYLVCLTLGPSCLLPEGDTVFLQVKDDMSPQVPSVLGGDPRFVVCVFIVPYIFLTLHPVGRPPPPLQAFWRASDSSVMLCRQEHSFQGPLPSSLLAPWSHLICLSFSLSLSLERVSLCSPG